MPGDPKLNEYRDNTKEYQYGSLWRAGNKISVGYGFWGSGELMAHSNPKRMVKAWFDALIRDRGYSPADAILYGDWTDGRHMADQISPKTTYAEFRAQVRKDARPESEVHRENASYLERKEVRMALHIAGVMSEEKAYPKSADSLREE